MHRVLIVMMLLPGCITVTKTKDSDTGGGSDTGNTPTDTQTGDTHTPPDPDNDGDGVPASLDCDDTNADINPDALEVCDGIDNNCTDTIDDEAAATVDGVNFASVDEALVAVTDGAEVDLCPGTLDFTSFTLSTGTLTIHGVAGRDTTTLSALDGLTGFSVGGTAVLNLDGVTLTGSNTQAQSAIDVSSGATVNVTASRVTGNTQGVHLDGNTGGKTATLTADGTDFDTNGTADTNGGAIGAERSSAVTLTNCNVTGNTGLDGGGVFAQPSNFVALAVSLTGTTIDGNTAEDGGGLYMFGGGVSPTLNVTDTTIQNNTATGHGGGLFLVNAAFVGSGVQILDNVATIAGGGAAITASPLSNALISRNDAAGGGGVAVLFDVDLIGAPLLNDLQAVVLDSNTSSDLGGALWVDDTMLVTIDSASSVTLNSATNGAGGAWLDGLTAEVISSDADWGDATTGNDNTPNDLSFGDNTAGVLFDGISTFDCTGNGCL